MADNREIKRVFASQKNLKESVSQKICISKNSLAYAKRWYHVHLGRSTGPKKFFRFTNAKKQTVLKLDHFDVSSVLLRSKLTVIFGLFT